MTEASEFNTNNIRISGELEKKNRTRWQVVGGGTWKRYWFVLQGRLLVYYRSRNEYVQHLSPCRGSINLGTARQVRLSRGTCARHPHILHVVHGSGQAVQLRTESQSDLERWLAALLEATGSISMRRTSVDDLRTVSSPCLGRNNTLPPGKCVQRRQSMLHKIRKLSQTSRDSSALPTADVYMSRYQDACRRTNWFHRKANHRPATPNSVPDPEKAVFKDDDVFQSLTTINNNNLKHGERKKNKELDKQVEEAQKLVNNELYTKVLKRENSNDNKSSNHDSQQTRENNTDVEQSSDESEWVHINNNENQPDHKLQQVEIDNDLYLTTNITNIDKKNANHNSEEEKGNEDLTTNNTIIDVKNIYHQSEEVTVEKDLCLTTNRNNNNAKKSTHKSEQTKVDNDLHLTINKNNTNAEKSCTKSLQEVDNEIYLATRKNKTNGKKSCAESQVDNDLHLTNKNNTVVNKSSKKSQSAEVDNEIYLTTSKNDASKKSCTESQVDNDLYQINRTTDECESTTNSQDAEVDDPLYSEPKITTEDDDDYIYAIPNFVKDNKKQSTGFKNKSRAFILRMIGRKSQNYKRDIKPDIIPIEPELPKPRCQSETISESEPEYDTVQYLTTENMRRIKIPKNDIKQAAAIEELNARLEHRKKKVENNEDIELSCTDSEPIPPSLPPRILAHRQRSPVRLDDILEELGAPSKKLDPAELSVKQLIQRFDMAPEEHSQTTGEENVTLRRKSDTQIIIQPDDYRPHSDELNKLLEQLARVTHAPLTQRGTTTSLPQPPLVELTDEEWLAQTPIRRRRHSEPDYDVPRPHRPSIQLPPPEDALPATRFFGPVLPSTEIPITPLDSLEPSRTHTPTNKQGHELFLDSLEPFIEATTIF